METRLSRVKMRLKAYCSPSWSADWSKMSISRFILEFWSFYLVTDSHSWVTGPLTNQRLPTHPALSPGCRSSRSIGLLFESRTDKKFGHSCDAVSYKVSVIELFKDKKKGISSPYHWPSWPLFITGLIIRLGKLDGRRSFQFPAETIPSRPRSVFDTESQGLTLLWDRECISDPSDIAGCLLRVIPRKSQPPAEMTWESWDGRVPEGLE